MQAEEVFLTAIVFLIGLFLAIGLKKSSLLRYLMAVGVFSVLILVKKGVIVGLVFLMTFFPLVFLQNQIVQSSSVSGSSSIFQKIMGYLAVLPIFGISLIFRRELNEVFMSWRFPVEVLAIFEFGLLAMTIFWILEWMKIRRGGLE